MPSSVLVGGIRTSVSTTSGRSSSIVTGSESRSTHVATRGAASLAGLDAVVADLLMQSRYGPRMSVLFDHSRLDLRTLESGDLVRRLHLALKDADLMGPKLIAVVSRDARVARRYPGRA